MPATLDEKIAILVFLASSGDEELRAPALETLRSWNVDDLKQVLASPATSTEVLDFAMEHLVGERPELVEALIHNPTISPAPAPLEAKDLIAQKREAERLAAPLTDGKAAVATEGERPARQTLLQRIAQMSAGQKIRLALMGSTEERMILIRDSNKAVARAVLQSPKLTDLEAEAYASMKAVTEEVLRTLAANPARMKHYAIARALINNPRAPLDVTLPLVPRLANRDLKALSINKNVADVLRATSAKLHRERTTPRGAAFPRKP